METATVNWGTVGVSALLALITYAVPAVLSALLSRKNANKKLNLSETSVMISGTESQIKTYQDLLDRANQAVAKAEKLNDDLSKRVQVLEDNKDRQTWQIVTLRNLFKQVVNRSNIVLTPDEQAEFDSTQPSVAMWAKAQQRQQQEPT